jgi:phenylalanyl-tRNA synthetase beta chain
MKVSYNWLKEVVDIPVDADALTRALTMVGIQLESKTPYEDDFTLDFEVTVNRPDCLSIYGLAREIALIFSSPAPAVNGLNSAGVIPFMNGDGRYSSAGKEVRILIEDSDLCPRYCGQLITGAKVGPSPAWMQKKLEACGLRPINNVVDITNFVMLELGQPMHAFDFDALSEGTIRVRKASANEKLKMIDGKERQLNDSMLVIADASRPVAVAGVMGGMETEVTESSVNILLESAYFQPGSVRRTAKALELSTDASYRFERGADYKMQANACLRASSLLEEYAGASLHPVLDVCPGRFVPAEIRLRHPRIARILGQTIDPHFVDNILTALGFIKKAETVWQVPSFRVDVFREIDLIEEIARHSGYNNIPSTLPKTDKKYQADYPTFEMERAIGQYLRGAGFDEAYTYSFVNSTEGGIRIINPIAETAAGLRTSLLPNLQESIDFNLRHRNENIALFEIGRVFLSKGEKTAVGIAALTEYRRMEGVIEKLFDALQYDQMKLQDGLISLSGTTVGRMIQSQIDSNPLQLCEIYLTDLIDQPKRPLRYEPAIPFPFVERDLSFYVDKNVAYSQFEMIFHNVKQPELQKWTLLDRYAGKNVPPGKVSMTFRFKFQSPDRTLTSTEVDKMFETIVQSLTKNFQIEIRK